MVSDELFFEAHLENILYDLIPAIYGEDAKQAASLDHGAYLWKNNENTDMVNFSTLINKFWMLYSRELNHDTDTSNRIGIVSAIEIAEGEYDYRVNLINGITYTHDINLATIFPMDQLKSLKKNTSEILIPVIHVSGHLKKLF